MPVKDGHADMKYGKKSKCACGKMGCDCGGKMPKGKKAMGKKAMSKKAPRRPGY